MSYLSLSGKNFFQTQSRLVGSEVQQEGSSGDDNDLDLADEGVGASEMVKKCWPSMGGMWLGRYNNLLNFIAFQSPN